MKVTTKATQEIFESFFSLYFFLVLGVWLFLH